MTIVPIRGINLKLLKGSEVLDDFTDLTLGGNRSTVFNFFVIVGFVIN